ncbi:hypothetical protein [Enteractinococcus helveticum]|nr:hypothetical protein [Enteractinococcus helveticum]
MTQTITSSIHSTDDVVVTQLWESLTPVFAEIAVTAPQRDAA